ncbi:MAG: ABC transporter substrate-binding protein, partial [Deltaproteobacteria bacterium]|nr:ABC transporter substrate-binding protein [Deltaproteobacteria bacterium]
MFSAITLGQADTPAPTEISVGAYLSMTGATATFGVATHEGIQLAIELYNVRAKRKVKLRVIDTAGKPSEGAVAVTRLIDDGAVAIIGEVSSSITLAGAAVAQQRGIPMITPSATHPNITDAGDMISRTCLTDDAQAYAIAKFAKGQRWKRVSILFDQQQPYSVGMVTAFESAYK